MGKITDTTTQDFEATQTTSNLVDFLYIDIERIDSLISQLQQGTLRSISKTIGTTQGYSSFSKLKLGAKVIEGETSRTESNNNNELSTENYDPYHSKIIEVLNLLNLELISSEQSYSAKLGIITGGITIRDLSTFSNILPVMLKHPSTFGKLDKSTQNNLKAMKDFIDCTPSTIDITIHSEKGFISGTINPGNLLLSMPDLLKNFGTALPGKWIIIGIFDTMSKNDNPQLVPDFDQTIESVVDIYANAMSTLYAQAKTRVIPLVIFRELEV